ncbi:MAG TPA: ABC transporter permease [Blastocatellia bacterium]|nr:ABC transporter permease [Blastocatellia bacterium]
MKLRSLVASETLAMALDNIRAHKFRSFLTVLGIVIGVTTVIAIASILTGLRANIVSFVEEYGTNNIYAFHLSTGISFGPHDRTERTRKPLRPEDGEAIKEYAPAVEDVANDGFIEWTFDKTITYGGQTYKQANLEGVSANYGAVTNMSLQAGRFISEIDDQHRRDVMVIGQGAAEALFPQGTESVIGKEVMMNGKPYEIIGVLEPRKGGILGETEENSVLIPYRTLRKVSPRSEWMIIIIRARSGQLKQALDQVEDILRRQRAVKYDDKNNFDLNTADKFIEQFDSVTAMVGLVAIALSSVGLLVGGIGVMNIMLVSVTERTAEIGVRKAIGARRRDITNQFLFEAMTLTFLGGVLGVIFAVAVSQIIILIFPSLPASIPLWAVVAGLVVSAAIGLIFGVWPARKAARLDPIEALRYE